MQQEPISFFADRQLLRWSSGGEAVQQCVVRPDLCLQALSWGKRCPSVVERRAALQRLRAVGRRRYANTRGSLPLLPQQSARFGPTIRLRHFGRTDLYMHVRGKAAMRLACVPHRPPCSCKTYIIHRSKLNLVVLVGGILLNTRGGEDEQTFIYNA